MDGITDEQHVQLFNKELINNDQPLLMANSDQFVEWDSNKTLYTFSNSKCDGGILTFTASHPKLELCQS